MRPIGGYFELELNRGKEYHQDAIKLNLGRTAFEYILRTKKVQRVFMPFYTCDVMLEPIIKTGTTYEFYHIDKNLEPVFDFNSLKTSDYFLYTNYFGLKDNFVKQLANRIANLIIDNSQSFFSKPIPCVDTFYSPRKFFGVPDGAYLYTDKLLKESFDTDDSSDRFEHLLGRIENGAEKSFQKFKINDQRLCNQPIKIMSNITKRLLQNINYVQVAKIRKRNFQYLHENLAAKNILKFAFNSEFVPMVYPFLSTNERLRVFLIEQKIFVARYWPNVFEWVKNDSFEFELSSNMIAIPIDQRCILNDLKIINQLIK